MLLWECNYSEKYSDIVMKDYSDNENSWMCGWKKPEEFEWYNPVAFSPNIGFYLPGKTISFFPLLIQH